MRYLHYKVLKVMYNLLFLQIFLITQCTRHLCHVTEKVATCQFSIIPIETCLPISVKEAQAFSFCLWGKGSGEI